MEIPDMMMVLFFLGDFSFSFEDSLSCRMAASATGSEPFSTNSSAGGGGVDTLASAEDAVGPPSTAGFLCGHMMLTDVHTASLHGCVSYTPFEVMRNSESR